MNKNIVLYRNEFSKVFESFEDIFQYISEEGIIVNSIEDGIIDTDKGLFNFSYISNEGTKTIFSENIISYRDNLRASILTLKKQGIQISKKELLKLAKQFEFLKGDTVFDSEMNNQNGGSLETK